MGRNTLPNWMIWLTELRMMSTGTANPTPLLAPEGEYIAVLMPAWQQSYFEASQDKREAPCAPKKHNVVCSFCDDADCMNKEAGKEACCAVHVAQGRWCAPMRSPLVSRRGPPELPGLMAASV